MTLACHVLAYKNALVVARFEASHLSHLEYRTKFSCGRDSYHEPTKSAPQSDMNCIRNNSQDLNHVNSSIIDTWHVCGGQAVPQCAGADTGS